MRRPQHLPDRIFTQFARHFHSNGAARRRGSCGCSAAADGARRCVHRSVPALAALCCTVRIMCNRRARGPMPLRGKRRPIYAQFACVPCTLRPEIGERRSDFVVVVAAVVCLGTIAMACGASNCLRTLFAASNRCDVVPSGRFVRAFRILEPTNPDTSRKRLRRNRSLRLPPPRTLNIRNALTFGSAKIHRHTTRCID